MFHLEEAIHKKLTYLLLMVQALEEILKRRYALLPAGDVVLSHVHDVACVQLLPEGEAA